MSSRIVLVVEGNSFTLKFLAYQLSGNGFDVRTAGSVGEALRRLRDDRPGLIFLDSQLPGLTELTLAQLKDESGGADVVAMTPPSGEGDETSPLLKGFDGSVPRLSDATTFPATAARYLGQRQE